MLGGAGVEKQCRKTDILADAAYCILTKPKNFTGNFVIDEDLLRQEGITNFDVYAVAPGNLDLFSYMRSYPHITITELQFY